MIDVAVLKHHTSWDEVKNISEVVTEVIDASSSFTGLIPSNGEVCVSVVLASDDFVQDLNKQYRNKDKPTNVLSFANYNLLEGEELPSEFECELGDIILAYETILKEAVEQGKSFMDHFKHLLIHGFLHLLGYDHDLEEKAVVMEAKEIAILANLGISTPY